MQELTNSINQSHKSNLYKQAYIYFLIKTELKQIVCEQNQELSQDFDEATVGVEQNPLQLRIIISSRNKLFITYLKTNSELSNQLQTFLLEKKMINPTCQIIFGYRSF